MFYWFTSCNKPKILGPVGRRTLRFKWSKKAANVFFDICKVWPRKRKSIFLQLQNAKSANNYNYAQPKV
jgi:hypothetical protein